MLGSGVCGSVVRFMVLENFLCLFFVKVLVRRFVKLFSVGTYCRLVCFFDII